VIPPCAAAWHDFVLKLCHDPTDDFAVTGSPPPARADGRKKILIVDDDPEVVEVLRRFLEKSPEGYVVEVANNGEDAVAALVLEAPDLVLLDLNMPRMNGVEVLRHVDRNIPVMIVSGNTDSMPAEALKLGAFAYIPKPVDFNYVEQLVPLALTRRRPPQAWVSKSGA
jgi:two-component system OmpR family response regulator